LDEQNYRQRYSSATSAVALRACEFLARLKCSYLYNLKNPACYRTLMTPSRANPPPSSLYARVRGAVAPLFHARLPRLSCGHREGFRLRHRGRGHLPGGRCGVQAEAEQRPNSGGRSATLRQRRRGVQWRGVPAQAERRPSGGGGAATLRQRRAASRCPGLFLGTLPARRTTRCANPFSSLPFLLCETEQPNPLRLIGYLYSDLI